MLPHVNVELDAPIESVLHAQLGSSNDTRFGLDLVEPTLNFLLVISLNHGDVVSKRHSALWPCLWRCDLSFCRVGSPGCLEPASNQHTYPRRSNSLHNPHTRPAFASTSHQPLKQVEAPVTRHTQLPTSSHNCFTKPILKKSETKRRQTAADFNLALY